jgi:hypothetical protein
MRAAGAGSLTFRDGDNPAAVHVERRPDRACEAKISPSTALVRGKKVGGEGSSDRPLRRWCSSRQGAEWPRICSEREGREVELVCRTKTCRHGTAPHAGRELRLREDDSARDAQVRKIGQVQVTQRRRADAHNELAQIAVPGNHLRIKIEYSKTNSFVEY